VSMGTASASNDHDNDSSSSSSSSTHASIDPEDDDNDGRIVQSLFRFPASELGPEFDELLQDWHRDWLHTGMGTSSSSSNDNSLPPIIPEASGKSHALHSVSTDAATIFRRQCYAPPIVPPTTTSDSNSTHVQSLYHLYKNYEQQRKLISFRYNDDANEEMRLMHIMTKRFYPAFLPPNENAM